MDKIINLMERKTIYRTVTVDVLGVLDEMESYFRCQLKASMDVYPDITTFSDETWQDVQIMYRKLEMLKTCTLITDKEYSELRTIFSDIRYQWLENAREHYNCKTEDINDGN